MAMYDKLQKTMSDRDMDAYMELVHEDAVFVFDAGSFFKLLMLLMFLLLMLSFLLLEFFCFYFFSPADYVSASVFVAVAVF